MNSLPIDNPSSPERREKASDLVILGCPSCGHRLRLAYQHLGVAGNCVRCHTAIMGVEFSPGNFGAVYVNRLKKESPPSMAGTVSREVDQSPESPLASQNEDSNERDTGVHHGLTKPVNPPDFGPLPQFVAQPSPAPTPGGSPFGPATSKPQEFGALPPANGLVGPAPAKTTTEHEAPNQGRSAILSAISKPVRFESLSTSTSVFPTLNTQRSAFNTAVPASSNPFSGREIGSSANMEPEAVKALISDAIFGPSTVPDQPSPAPQIAPDQTPPLENASTFGELSADSAQSLGSPRFAAVPSVDGGSHGVVDEAPKVTPQFDPFGPPVKDAGTAINHQPSPTNHSKNPFVVNLTGFSNLINPQENKSPASSTVVPCVGTSVTTASQNSQPAVQTQGADDQFSHKLEVLSPEATPQEISMDVHTRDSLVAASATPTPQAPAPKNNQPPEPVTFPPIKLPKVAPPKDNLSTSNILALLFVGSVICGFGSYILTPYEKKEQIKSQLVEWLEPGSVVIEQLPFGLGKKVLE